jgi:hypothetical protein
LPLAIISAKDPFFGALDGPPSVVGGGVGWPFLKVDDAVRVGVRPFESSFIFDIEVSTPEGRLLGFMGREELAVAREPEFVRWSLSAGRRRGSLSEALRLGGMGMGMVDWVGLGSPVIWARRSPIFVILLVCFSVELWIEGTVPAWLWREVVVGGSDNQQVSRLIACFGGE